MLLVLHAFLKRKKKSRKFLIQNVLEIHFSKRGLDFDVSKPKHSCKSQLFWKKMTLETEKDISCLKAFAFSIVFFSLATSKLPYLAMGSPGQLPTLPNGFPFVETRLTSEEKKLVKPLQGRFSCYPVGCVTSLVTIITNGRSRRDLPLATSWRRVPPPTSPKICVSKREETMRQFGDNAHAQRDTW